MYYMQMIDLIRKILSNRVLLYVSSRYFVYALQFLLLIVIATKLGVTNYGSWGFFLLLLSYCNIINFGIANSVSYFLIQNKNNELLTRYYASASYILIAVMVIISFLFFIISFYTAPTLFTKYHILDKIIFLSIIAAIQYVNTLFSNIYRVKNRLLELAIYQSSIPFCMLIAIVVSPHNLLFDFLIYSYLIAHLFSLLIFIFRGQLPKFSLVPIIYIKQLLKKGFFLFIYNSCFYLIHSTTSLVISIFYSVDDYGLYSFSYSLGHSILLLLEAFTFVVFPKIVDKYYSAKREEFSVLISIVRNNYIKLSHLLMYFALLCFPLITFFFPQYSGALQAMYITSLSILISTNAFGYNTLLLAKNYEKSISKVSILSLLLNVFIVVLIAAVFKLSFVYAVMSMIVVYYTFSLGCIILTNKMFNLKFSVFCIFNEAFEWELLIPFIIALALAFMQCYSLMFIPIILFVILNYTSIKEITISIKRVIFRPNIIDIN